MHIHEILRSMRAGQEQDGAAIRAFVEGVVAGSVSRPQAAAWLAFAFRRGLTSTETLALTRAMTASGTVLRWPDGPPVVDKHSTGGVGDKVSLILAPLWAELGLRVPMISGRGLGHTGGTLDKLEAIPGFTVDLPNDRLQAILADVGCFMAGQTDALAPADRTLYALRNEVECVESIPLIVASILSKKLAEGISRLVLDVKFGNGAFMTELDDARALARALVDVASGAGVACSAHLTAMDRPLGRAVGHSLEVAEAVACLKGGGPDDLRDLTVHLAEHPDAAAVLASGRAYERFCRLVAAHGGDPDALEGGLLGGGCRELTITAEQDGYLVAAEARPLAHATYHLGGGRSRAEDPIDFGVGLVLHAHPGDRVVRGQPLLTLHHRDGRGLDLAEPLARGAMRVGPEAPSVPPLIVESLRGDPAPSMG
jgi:pyrimidine-nucleoside phosphorylase